MGRSSSLRSRSSDSAPASAAPFSAVRSAARLLDTRASDPPRPTILRGRAVGSSSITILRSPAGPWPRIVRDGDPVRPDGSSAVSVELPNPFAQPWEMLRVVFGTRLPDPERGLGRKLAELAPDLQHPGPCRAGLGLDVVERGALHRLEEPLIPPVDVDLLAQVRSRLDP